MIGNSARASLCFLCDLLFKLRKDFLCSYFEQEATEIAESE